MVMNELRGPNLAWLFNHEKRVEKNYHYIINDNRFKFDMEELIDNSILESSTNEP